MAAPLPRMHKNILKNHISIRTRQTIRLESLSECCYIRSLAQEEREASLYTVHKKCSRDKQENNRDMGCREETGKEGRMKRGGEDRTEYRYR